MIGIDIFWHGKKPITVCFLIGGSDSDGFFVIEKKQNSVLSDWWSNLFCQSGSYTPDAFSHRKNENCAFWLVEQLVLKIKKWLVLIFFDIEKIHVFYKFFQKHSLFFTRLLANVKKIHFFIYFWLNQQFNNGRYRNTAILYRLKILYCLSTVYW